VFGMNFHREQTLGVVVNVSDLNSLGIHLFSHRIRTLNTTPNAD
jgi:hypothetical protein